MREYKLYEGSLQQQFANSRKKIQIFGGGFGNGKTTSSIVSKVLCVARDYPGANILVARETLVKVNKTVRKEFIKWCPKSWIERFPQPEKDATVCYLKNGTTIEFNFIDQQGKLSNEGEPSSNLLSATYDLIVVDQMEDAGIEYKDFTDLLGRLRGQAQYKPSSDRYDATMPLTGPRWLVMTCNPTRNWLFKRLVKPIQDYQKRGTKSEDLLLDKSGELIVDLFEGSTYTNKENLPDDFIETLETAYKGAMRKRFLLGEWAAYEGLIYPQFANEVHMLPHEEVFDYYKHLHASNIIPNIVEGFDYGIASPSAYLLGFVDHLGNHFRLGGFYTVGGDVPAMAKQIKDLRRKFFVTTQAHPCYSDPSIFRRIAGGTLNKLVGPSINALFVEEGITNMVRGNNNIENGIAKVSGYLTVRPSHRHPTRGTFGAPYYYASDNLIELEDEFSNYMWKKGTSGDVVDKPVDKNDHYMDVEKYILSVQTDPAMIVKQRAEYQAALNMWHEQETSTFERSPRHG